MAMDKDKSIITQVAAKIASDLAIHNISIDDFAEKFVGVTEVLYDAIYGPDMGEPVVQNGTVAIHTPDVAQVVAQVSNAFPTASVDSTVRVKGKQHGPLPEWLVANASKDGITEVWDNRDGLTENPKRPWFKSTTGNKAYWPPRGR